MSNFNVECIIGYSDFFTKGFIYRGYFEGDVFITTDDDNSKNALFNGEYKIPEELG